MAFSIQRPPFPSCSFNHRFSGNKVLPKNTPQKRPIQCTAAKQQQHHQRPLPVYQPTSWSHELMESIGNKNYHAMNSDEEEEEMKKMEEEVRCMIENEDTEEPLNSLELIDDIHRLGMGYRFKDSIEKGLDKMTSLGVEKKIHKNLHACALFFRLRRQHGYCVSTDIFEKFKDSNGNFSTSIAKDILGLLSLYEASHLAFDGETTLDEAREFASIQLKSILTSESIDMKSAVRIEHALELPLHYRMPRLEARWNIAMYDKPNKEYQILHRLAILDFNMVQSVHQRDLQEVSRWWRHVGLANKLSFARDRLMESFFWTIGMVFEPQFSKCRIGLTKVVVLITVLDDIYDVYGSPEELEQLTNAIDKWDVNFVNELPDYMKLCFFALYNTVNELAYDTLKEQNQVIISPLKQGWADLCKTFLREARWSYKKHIPKFDEYMDHGWTSSSGVALLIHAYFLVTPTTTDDAIKSLIDSDGLLRFPCTIFRLANDLSSSKEDVERGEVAKAVPCYMRETGASHEAARAYIKTLIDHYWKMMNKEITYNSIFEKSFVETCCNLARIALCQYQYGDEHSAPTDVSRNRIKSVIIEPIQLLNPRLRSRKSFKY